MSVKGERHLPKPLVPDAGERLAESLLATELTKRGRRLLVRFDTLADSDTAYTLLRSMRDNYRPRDR
jgi:hypothetical protein